MDFGILVVTLLLFYALILFITEALPYDITAISIMAILVFTGILTADQAVYGLASRPVITIGALFVVSAGLIRSGAIDLISERIIAFSGGRPLRILLISTLMAAVLSAFINDTPVVMIFIPIILTVSSRHRISPSKLLIPISYACILGGSCTLIGTSNNILISGLSLSLGGPELSMFELSRLGVITAASGILFMLLFSQKILPERRTFTDYSSGGSAHYMTELIIQEESSLAGQTVEAGFSAKYPDIDLFEIIKGRMILYPPYDDIVIDPGDTLLIRAGVNDFMALLKSKDVKVTGEDMGEDFKISEKKMMLGEVLITPNSKFINETVMDPRFKEELGLNIIAVQRRGVHHRYGAFNRPLTLGDILLVQADESDLKYLSKNPNLMRLEGVEEQVVDRSKAPISIAIMMGVIIMASSGVLNIMVWAMLGAMLMVMTRCLRLRTAYRSIDFSVLMLIAGTMALGSAMSKTGAAQLYAEGMYYLLGGYGPRAVLSGLLCLAILMSNIMNSKATASLFTPIALSLAGTVGVDARPFLIALCFGVNAPFATPVGFQTNMLVLGPGGYKFVDYIKMGAPLCLLVWILGSLLIPLLWAF
jgi:di/tricarboxylate transporter